LAAGLLLAAGSLLLVPAGNAQAEGCVTCHSDKTNGFAAGHAFAAENCTLCHGGDNAATEKQRAHDGLITHPGQLDTAQRSCGSCHADLVDSVSHGLMSTARGMVDVTRRAFGEAHQGGAAVISELGNTPADSLLRKLCASCHLGQQKQSHQLDVTRDRGGGCTACHVNESAKPGSHVMLTRRVEDGRCFGCHSRSSRISLNYAGLAEALPDIFGRLPTGAMQLEDGRTVIARPSDVHHRAGMSCIDCHTSIGLMGQGDNSHHQRQAVDISCEDCHLSSSATVSVADWPAAHASLREYLPEDTPEDARFIVTRRHGTPLWHVLEKADGRRQLLTKHGQAIIDVPLYSRSSHPLAEQHQRLHCSACHSQWAPQCYGCHMRYEADGEQKDHLQQETTPGRWHEQRWDVRSDLPPLGIAADERVRPFVPGMIMTIQHPSWQGGRFRRLFASNEPHTSGRARDCASCHASAKALGLGSGELSVSGNKWHFRSISQPLADGLPADAWTTLDGSSGDSVKAGERPFSPAEMQRILQAMPVARDKER
jgi:hypothetical protein